MNGNGMKPAEPSMTSTWWNVNNTRPVDDEYTETWADTTPYNVVKTSTFTQKSDNATGFQVALKQKKCSKQIRGKKKNNQSLLAKLLLFSSPWKGLDLSIHKIFFWVHFKIQTDSSLLLHCFGLPLLGFCSLGFSSLGVSALCNLVFFSRHGALNRLTSVMQSNLQILTNQNRSPPQVFGFNFIW